MCAVLLGFVGSASTMSGIVNYGGPETGFWWKRNGWTYAEIVERVIDRAADDPGLVEQLTIMLYVGNIDLRSLFEENPSHYLRILELLAIVSREAANGEFDTSTEGWPLTEECKRMFCGSAAELLAILEKLRSYGTNPPDVSA